MSLKWYTRARRFPQLIGRTPDGTRIWGGPYTYTQVGVSAAVAVLLSRTTWLWAHGGLILNAVLFIGICVATVILTGKLPPGFRNPLVLASGVMNLFTTGYHGGGHRLHTKTARPDVMSPVIIYETSAPVRVPDPQPTPATTKVEPLLAPTARRRFFGHGNGLVQPQPALSNVQRLLLGAKV